MVLSRSLSPFYLIKSFTKSLLCCFLITRLLSFSFTIVVVCIHSIGDIFGYSSHRTRGHSLSLYLWDKSCQIVCSKCLVVISKFECSPFTIWHVSLLLLLLLLREGKLTLLLMACVSVTDERTLFQVQEKKGWCTPHLMWCVSRNERINLLFFFLLLLRPQVIFLLLRVRRWRE